MGHTVNIFTRFKSINNLVFTIMCLFCLAQISACSYKDEIMEKNLNKALLGFRGSNSESMSLDPILGGGWSEVCIQTPYMLKENFEKASRRKINFYRNIGDGENRFWIFFEDKSIRWLDVPRVSVMDFKQDSAGFCTTKKYPFIYAGEFVGPRSFYFMSNQ